MKDSTAAGSNNSEALATVGKVLTEIGWDPQPEEKVPAFYVDLGPPHIPVSDAFAAIAPDAEQFVFYVNFGPAAPPGRAEEVARFLTHANWGLTIGNFEMDFSDGHIRFKSSINFAHTQLSEILIRNAILSAMNAVDAYADLLIEVITGKKSAEQAIQEAKAR